MVELVSASLYLTPPAPWEPSASRPVAASTRRRFTGIRETRSAWRLPHTAA